MSTSLRNARSQISALHGRLEGLNLLNMDNVQAFVDKRVENITGVVNKLSSTCTSQCAVQNSPQCKLAFAKMNALILFPALFFLYFDIIYFISQHLSSYQGYQSKDNVFYFASYSIFLSLDIS